MESAFLAILVIQTIVPSASLENKLSMSEGGSVLQLESDVLSLKHEILLADHHYGKVARHAF